MRVGLNPIAYLGVRDDAILSISDGRFGVLMNCKEGNVFEDRVCRFESKTNFSSRDNLIFLEF